MVILIYFLVMKSHRIAEAKARFSELVQDTPKAPHLILHRNRPVAVLVGIEDWNRLRALDEAAKKRPMTDLLDELAGINQDEADFETPARSDRKVPHFAGSGARA